MIGNRTRILSLRRISSEGFFVRREIDGRGRLITSNPPDHDPLTGLATPDLEAVDGPVEHRWQCEDTVGALTRINLDPAFRYDNSYPNRGRQWPVSDRKKTQPDVRRRHSDVLAAEISCRCSQRQPQRIQRGLGRDPCVEFLAAPVTDSYDRAIKTIERYLRAISRECHVA